MRWPLSYALAFAYLWTSCSALHASEAGVVDWHTPLIGRPLTETPSTAPVFHRVVTPNDTTESVILTATKSNVLAALNPVDGSLAWRYIFAPEDRILSFQRHEDVVASLSGPGGSTLRIFDALEGHLILEERLHRPGAGVMFEPETLGAAITFAAPSETSQDLLVLTGGSNLRRISQNGELVWSWTSQDQTSLVVYTKVTATSNAVYVAGLAKSFAGYTLHVTVLDPATGLVLADQPFGAELDNGATDLLCLSAPSSAASASPANPRLIWLEKGSIRSLDLTPQLDAKPLSTKGAKYAQVLDVALGSHGQFVGIKSDGAGRVFKLDGTVIKAVADFPKSERSEEHTGSIYSGGLDKEGHPYVARIFWSNRARQGAVQIYASHLSQGQGVTSGFIFPFDTNQHGIISHATADFSNPERETVMTRLTITTSTGAIQLWENVKHVWTREESLASISAAEFVELPEKAQTSVARDAEPYIHRLTRHISDAKNLPDYIVHFIQRFATGSYASVSSPTSSPSNSSEALYRDPFGFKKVIVVATPAGKAFGLDSSTGRIVWSRVLGLGWAAEVGARVVPLKIYTTQVVGEGPPQVILIAQRIANNGLSDTVGFHIEALTGEDVIGKSPGPGLLQGVDVIPGALVDAFFLPEIKAAVLFDEFLQVSLFPHTPEIHDQFVKLVPSLHFALRSGKPTRRQLTGHKLLPEPQLGGKYAGYPTWTSALPFDEEIKSIITRPREPVASLGKVLADRTTLYKYLNPHLVVVLAASPASTPPNCPIYLVDTVKGSVVWRTAVPAAGGICNVHASLAENWLVYHYFHEEFAGANKTKSWRMVSVELYEGHDVDSPTRSSELSSFSALSLNSTSYEQVYIFPHGVSAIATTTTKFGMTAKDIIVATEMGQIQSYPRRLLDPRRPKRKPTNEEQSEEWLLQYDSLLPENPRSVLSHTYEIAQVRQIVTSPALLESTSLIFAYGLDLFGSRTAPSRTFDVLSEDFNKAQLVFTIGGLAVAILVARPMVQRKRLREKWYQ